MAENNQGQSVPFGSFGFKVKVEGVKGEWACFQEVSGLSAQLSTEDLVEGGVNYTTRKLLGHASYSNVTLKRGLCSTSMYGWIRGIIDGSNLASLAENRMTVTISILGDDGSEVKKFKLSRAIPVKWDGPSLSVMQDGIATESLEFAHEGLSVE